MGDNLHTSHSIKKLEEPSMATSQKKNRSSLVASGGKVFPQKIVKSIASLDHGRLGSRAAGDIAFFLLKVGALEMVRRFSRAKCPLAWRAFQALQVFCYPPFKWIQRWTPFKGLIKGMQTLSRPLLFLSIATAFSDQSEYAKETSESDASPPFSEPDTVDHAKEPTLDTRICDVVSESPTSEDWLLQLYKELEKQGITLPERITNDEIHRFYLASNGDFSSLMTSIKKTIRWRETYSILSLQELEMWSRLVFWHGRDVKCRPCLIIRLGLACSTLASDDRPRFTQAIVSQIEHGILQFINVEDPQITVLMDCKGLSPLRFPMQILRSCCVVVQDHYPNRLGCLFIIRLPSVVRVIAQTFIQVLKPVTRKKLRIEGDAYQKVLGEYLETLPSFLGGKCTCANCSIIGISSTNPRHNEIIDEAGPSGTFTNYEGLSLLYDSYETDLINGDCEQVLRAAIVGILMLAIFIAFVGSMYDPESPLFPF